MSVNGSEILVEKFINFNDIEHDIHLRSIFYQTICEYLDEEDVLTPCDAFYIDYDEKYCIFNDTDIDYGNGEKGNTNIKIILINSTNGGFDKESFKKLFSSFNIFTFKNIP